MIDKRLWFYIEFRFCAFNKHLSIGLYPFWWRMYIAHRNKENGYGQFGPFSYGWNIA